MPYLVSRITLDDLNMHLSTPPVRGYAGAACQLSLQNLKTRNPLIILIRSLILDFSGKNQSDSQSEFHISGQSLSRVHKTAYLFLIFLLLQTKKSSP